SETASESRCASTVISAAARGTGDPSPQASAIPQAMTGSGLRRALMKALPILLDIDSPPAGAEAFLEELLLIDPEGLQQALGLAGAHALCALPGLAALRALLPRRRLLRLRSLVLRLGLALLIWGVVWVLAVVFF